MIYAAGTRAPRSMGRPRKPMKIEDELVLDIMTRLGKHKDALVVLNTGTASSYLGDVRMGHIKEPSIVRMRKLLRNVGLDLAIVSLERSGTEGR